MIEYLYDAIRATAGEDINITAKITTEDGENIDTGCHLNLYDNENTIATINGVFVADLWQFTIPAETTNNLKGRYWYCICDLNHSTLNFKQPIYLV